MYRRIPRPGLANASGVGETNGLRVTRGVAPGWIWRTPAALAVLEVLTQSLKRLG